MARPKKTGLDYFPMDVDFWNDIKIMDLLNEYGPLGTAVYNIIINLVYKNGYYIEVSPEQLALMIMRIIGNKWITDKALLLNVIGYCGEIGLFDRELLKQSVVTSVGIQRRYNEITARNKTDKSKYWLLENDDSKTASVSAPENTVSAAETRVSAAEIPQKKSKEKKSKVNKSKVCIVTIPCRDGNFQVDEEYYNELTHTYKNTEVILSLQQLRNYMLSNPEKRRRLKNAHGCIEWWRGVDDASGKYPRKTHQSTYDTDLFEHTNAVIEEGF